MSSIGLVSVRLPVSLVAVFEEMVRRQGISTHEGGRRLLAGLAHLTPADLAVVAEPRTTDKALRISLYVGEPALVRLESVARSTGLSRSTVLRKLFFGLLVTGSLRFVQNPDTGRFQLTRVQNISSVPSIASAPNGRDSLRESQRSV